MLVTGGKDGRVCVLQQNMKNAIQVYQKHPQAVNSVAFSPDGNMIGSAGADKSVRLFDIRNNQELACFESHKSSVNCINFHPVERMLISGSDDRSICIFDIDKFKIIPVSFPGSSSGIRSVMF